MVGVALTCCVLFVSLKLYDHSLAEWSVFRTLTGHFWSKVADILQMHFIMHFFVAAGSYEARVESMRANLDEDLATQGI